MPSSAEAEKEEALAYRPNPAGVEQVRKLSINIFLATDHVLNLSDQSTNIFQKAALPTTLWGCWL